MIFLKMVTLAKRAVFCEKNQQTQKTKEKPI